MHCTCLKSIVTVHVWNQSYAAPHVCTHIYRHPAAGMVPFDKRQEIGLSSCTQIVMEMDDPTQRSGCKVGNENVSQVWDFMLPCLSIYMVQATHLPGLKTNPEGSWNQSHRIFVLLPLLWKEKFRRVRSTNEKLAPLFSLPGVLLAGGRGLYWKDSWFVKNELMLDCIIDIVQGFCMVLSQVITPYIYISHIHHDLETYGIADIIWRHNLQWIHDIHHTTFISMSHVRPGPPGKQVFCGPGSQNIWHT